VTAVDVHRCPACGLFAQLDVEAPSVHGCERCGGAVADDGAPQDVSFAALGEAIRSAPIPLLVEFWARDCQSCAGATLVLDAVGHRLAGELAVLRVDVDAAPEACDLHGVLAVPTVLMFSGGVERGRRVGPLTAKAVQAWIREAGGPAEVPASR
jgi:thioredoxin 2